MQTMTEMERLPDCGECAGCKREAMINSGLAEIDALFESRAEAMKAEYDRLGRYPEDHKREQRLQREWSARRWDFIQAMKPIGCINIAYMVKRAG